MIFSAPAQRCYFRALIGLMLMAFWPRAVHAQMAVPSATGGSRSGVYVLADAGKPNYRNDSLLGATAGAYIQGRPWLGFDGQLIALRWGPSEEHQYFALAGPRFAWNRGRWTAIGTAEAGIGHARYNEGTDSSYGFSWMLTGGLDMQLNYRFKWRVAQFSYGGIDVLDNGLNPKIISSGIVFRLF